MGPPQGSWTLPHAFFPIDLGRPSRWENGGRVPPNRWATEPSDGDHSVQGTVLNRLGEVGWLDLLPAVQIRHGSSDF